MSNLPSTDIEIVSTRGFKSPREVLFEAFADPQQLTQWWGPAAYTNTFSEFEFRPGGAWRFVMHSPNGTAFHNVSEFVTIARPELIVFQHLEPVHRFEMSMTFADSGGAPFGAPRPPPDSFRGGGASAVSSQ